MYLPPCAAAPFKPRVLHLGDARATQASSSPARLTRAAASTQRRRAARARGRQRAPARASAAGAAGRERTSTRFARQGIERGCVLPRLCGPSRLHNMAASPAAHPAVGQPSPEPSLRLKRGALAQPAHRASMHALGMLEHREHPASAQSARRHPGRAPEAGARPGAQKLQERAPGTAAAAAPPMPGARRGAAAAHPSV